MLRYFEETYGRDTLAGRRAFAAVTLNSGEVIQTGICHADEAGLTLEDRTQKFRSMIPWHNIARVDWWLGPDPDHWSHRLEPDK